MIICLHFGLWKQFVVTFNPSPLKKLQKRRFLIHCGQISQFSGVAEMIKKRFQICPALETYCISVLTSLYMRSIPGNEKTHESKISSNKDNSIYYSKPMPWQQHRYQHIRNSLEEEISTWRLSCICRVNSQINDKALTSFNFLPLWTSIWLVVR